MRLQYSRIIVEKIDTRQKACKACMHILLRYNVKVKKEEESVEHVCMKCSESHMLRIQSECLN